MHIEDRDWAGYLRSLSRNREGETSLTPLLQRSRGEDSIVGWEEEQRRLSEDIFNELVEVLGSRLREEPDPSDAWEDEETEFEKEINELFKDYEEDQKEISRNENKDEE